MTIGEMKKAIGEMENEISMALRSSDLQIGFEIICKKLSKLEKDNEELNEIRNGQARIINNDTVRIEKLKKENKELKEQLEVTNRENERIRRTMHTYSKCITEHQNTIKRKDEEITELKKDKEWFENTDKEQTEVILKLYEQIEKMKNVGNCKKAMTCAEWNEKQTMLSCMKFCKNCKDWELAE